jgi:outer membrane lipoprotein SlyB
MKAFKLAVLASALAAGCAASPPDNTYAFRPGTGTVASVQQARVKIPGGTAPKTVIGEATSPRWIQGYQLGLRMDDGTTQAITQDSDAFHAGDRVQVTDAGRIVKMAASAPAPASAPVSVLVPGTGTVQAIAANPSSAAAGGNIAGQEIQLRMDNGTTQWVNVQGATFATGDRVTVTADGRVLR